MSKVARPGHTLSLPGVVNVSVLVACLLVGADAAAQDGDPAQIAAARSLALEGIKLADSGRCDEAIDKLARAEKLHHAPVVLGRLGECQVNVGRLVEGTENLRKVMREPLPPDPPAVVTRARERAASVFERSKNRIASLHIVVKGPADHASVTVTVDGQPMNAALLEADRPTDPGEHLIEAGANGFISNSAKVSLGSGDRESVTITLEADPNARAVAPTPSDSATAADTTTLFTRNPPLVESGAAANGSFADSEPQRDLTAAYISWAAGGAALVTGAIFGLVAFQRKSDLDESCPDQLCPGSARDRLDSARSASTTATVLVAIGATGLGVGTVFYLSAGPDEEEATSATKKPPQHDALRARAFIGLGQVGVSGEF
ncbi:MAG: hypothetical protein RL685_4876 [Pseudomonadota bacterium]|jgi:hypothetical protein